MINQYTFAVSQKIKEANCGIKIVNKIGVQKENERESRGKRPQSACEGDGRRGSVGSHLIRVSAF